MIETIKQIGLFMIVAQTLMHFAAGEQYEKYIKIIAGVIVLLLFIGPFYSSGDNLAEQWQREMDTIAKDIENFSSQHSDEISDTDYGAGRDVTQRLEEEIKRKLNDEVKYDACEITDVLVEWEEEEHNEMGIQEMAVGNIKIVLRGTDTSPEVTEGEEEDGVFDPILIEKIQPGIYSQPDEQLQKDGQLQEYRSRFAGILGVEEWKIEVVSDGGR